MMINFFNQNNKRKHQPSIQDWAVLVFAAGLLYIAIVDKDYRATFNNLATSIITCYWMTRNDSKPES